jgi:hypothetical protein
MFCRRSDKVVSRDVFAAESIKEELWSILRLCSGILSLSDAELSEAFDLKVATIGSESPSGITAP